MQPRERLNCTCWVQSVGFAVRRSSELYNLFVLCGRTKSSVCVYCMCACVCELALVCKKTTTPKNTSTVFLLLLNAQPYSTSPRFIFIAMSNVFVFNYFQPSVPILGMSLQTKIKVCSKIAKTADFKLVQIFPLFNI